MIGKIQNKKQSIILLQKSNFLLKLLCEIKKRKKRFSLPPMISKNY